MLDSYLIAQGVLNSLKVLSLIILALMLIFMVFMVGAMVTKGTLKTFFRIGKYTTATILLALIVLLFIPAKRPRYEWKQDFSVNTDFTPFQNEKCSKAKSVSNPITDCIYEGDINVDFNFGNYRNFKKSGRAFWASGSADKVISLHFFDYPQTTQGIEKIVPVMLKDWGIPQDQFISWWNSSERDSTKGTRYFYANGEAASKPRLEIAVSRLPTSKKNKLWTVSYKWKWD